MPTDHDTVIADLKAEIQTFCKACDWDQFHGAKNLAIAVATEASELLELFRFVLRFGQRFDFDLANAVRAKLAANERRYPVEMARGSNRKARK